MSQRLQKQNTDNFQRSWKRTTCHFALGSPSDLWADCWFQLCDLKRVTDREVLASVQRLIRHAPTQAFNTSCRFGMLQHQAAAFGRMTCLEALLATPTADVNAVNNAGWTALHWACSTGQTAAAKFLLSCEGVDISIFPKSDARCTPLALAQDCGYGEIVDLIDPSGISAERLCGQTWRSPFDACSFCGAQDARKYCGLCGLAAYCGQRCANRHWKENHRADCTIKQSIRKRQHLERDLSPVKNMEMFSAPTLIDLKEALPLRFSKNTKGSSSRQNHTREFSSVVSANERRSTVWRNTGALDQLIADGNPVKWRAIHQQSFLKTSGTAETGGNSD